MIALACFRAIILMRAWGKAMWEKQRMRNSCVATKKKVWKSNDSPFISDSKMSATAEAVKDIGEKTQVIYCVLYK